MHFILALSFLLPVDIMATLYKLLTPLLTYESPPEEENINPNTSDTPVGQPASLGCVRMNEEDAKWLFERTEEGTTFAVIEHNGV